jgi:hypothetical protein
MARVVKHGRILKEGINKATEVINSLVGRQKLKPYHFTYNCVDARSLDSISKA